MLSKNIQAVLIATAIAIAGVGGLLYINSKAAPNPTNMQGNYIAMHNNGTFVGGPRNANNIVVDQQIMAKCNFTEPPGRVINYLFAHHSEFKFKYYEYPQNRTIVWIITGPKEDIDYLQEHIEQMECIIENGGNPRPFDPIFQVDAKITKEYVHTKIERVNETTLKVIKVADNDCAFEVIKLHAQIVKGFFETGRVEAQKIHEVPEEAKKMCAPYLNQ